MGGLWVSRVRIEETEKALIPRSVLETWVNLQRTVGFSKLTQGDYLYVVLWMVPGTLQNLLMQLSLHLY